MKALEDLGRAARARTEAKVAAVTGSVGKTSTKEALRAVLSLFAPTFASAGNLNNQWGAPLSLARMPRDTRYGVFELGMNHAGRDLAAVADGAAAGRHHHHGRAGAYRVLRLGGGDRRRQGRDLRRPDARRRGCAAVRQSAFRPAGSQGQAHGRAHPDLRRERRRLGAPDRLPGRAGRQPGDGGDRRQAPALSHGGARPAPGAEFASPCWRPRSRSSSISTRRCPASARCRR